MVLLPLRLLKPRSLLLPSLCVTYTSSSANHEADSRSSYRLPPKRNPEMKPAPTTTNPHRPLPQTRVIRQKPRKEMPSPRKRTEVMRRRKRKKTCPSPLPRGRRGTLPPLHPASLNKSQSHPLPPPCRLLLPKRLPLPRPPKPRKKTRRARRRKLRLPRVRKLRPRRGDESPRPSKTCGVVSIGIGRTLFVSFHLISKYLVSVSCRVLAF